MSFPDTYRLRRYKDAHFRNMETCVCWSRYTKKEYDKAFNDLRIALAVLTLRADDEVAKLVHSAVKLLEQPYGWNEKIKRIDN